ncbi:hypothetical protein Ciccas_010114 [Cichlidogyrus casuarinus]|uniref:Uncharacterized protein n=1 Tax=Cichlidogyrus casuarinus TaxID=1844966 RepID=A0ABD2PXX0_9PLAT
MKFGQLNLGNTIPLSDLSLDSVHLLKTGCAKLPKLTFSCLYSNGSMSSLVTSLIRCFMDFIKFINKGDQSNLAAIDDTIDCIDKAIENCSIIKTVLSFDEANLDKEASQPELINLLGMAFEVLSVAIGGLTTLSLAFARYSSSNESHKGRIQQIRESLSRLVQVKLANNLIPQLKKLCKAAQKWSASKTFSENLFAQLRATAAKHLDNTFIEKFPVAVPSESHLEAKEFVAESCKAWANLFGLMSSKLEQKAQFIFVCKHSGASDEKRA